MAKQENDSHQLCLYQTTQGVIPLKPRNRQHQHSYHANGHCPWLTIPVLPYELPSAWRPVDPISAASERSVHSIKSNESAASKLTVRSNPRPPEDSTPYTHSGALGSAFWIVRTGHGYSGYPPTAYKSDGSRQVHSSNESSSESPCWFWRPLESFFRTPAPREPEAGTPIGRKPEPFPWGVITSPSTGHLDAARENSHVRGREVHHEEKAKHSCSQSSGSRTS